MSLPALAYSVRVLAAYARASSSRIYLGLHSNGCF
jgi:hypothetical protein